MIIVIFFSLYQSRHCVNLYTSQNGNTYIEKSENYFKYNIQKRALKYNWLSAVIRLQFKCEYRLK